MFGGGDQFQQRAELDASCGQICPAVISSAAGGSSAASRNSSRAKMASSATAGWVR